MFRSSRFSPRPTKANSVPAIAGPESSNNAVAIPIMPRLIGSSIAFLPDAHGRSIAIILRKEAQRLERWTVTFRKPIAASVSSRVTPSSEGNAESDSEI